VLLVGQGPPATGGIPTFIAGLLASTVLEGRARLRYLNTTPSGERNPGALTAANLVRTGTDAVRVFKAARSAEVVHLNVSAVPLGPLVRAVILCGAARVAGAKTILHAHTGRLHRAVQSRAYRLVLRSVRWVSDVFVVVSRREESAARSVGLDPILIENGIDASGFRAGPKDDIPLVAFVGTVCARKGLIDLLGALERIRSSDLDPFHVLIVGDASQEGPRVFEEVRAAYDRADMQHVTFTGAIDRESVADVLARASVFCLPSHWEGLPLSLLEAMAAEAAPVAARVGEIPWVLDEGKAGILVDPHDPVALAAALTDLLRDPPRRAVLGRDARRRVMQVFSEDRLVRDLDRVYRNLAGYSM
jgi:glycosyltransferase involved in cell wall biosynthesis